MILKIESVQSKDFKNYPENNGNPYKIVDLNTIPKNYQKQYIKMLKVNQKAGMLKYSVIEL